MYVQHRITHYNLNLIIIATLSDETYLNYMPRTINFVTLFRTYVLICTDLQIYIIANLIAGWSTYTHDYHKPSSHAAIALVIRLLCKLEYTHY